MPVYLSVLMTTLVALPAAATMFLASYVLTIYVDFYRVQGGDRVPTDPRGKLCFSKNIVAGANGWAGVTRLVVAM